MVACRSSRASCAMRKATSSAGRAYNDNSIIVIVILMNIVILYSNTNTI